MSATEPEVMAPEPKKKKNGLAKRDPVAIERIEPHQPSMEEVLMAAVQSGASIETLERVSAMIERAQAKVAEREFNGALTAFQEAMPVIKKRKKVLNKDRVSTRFLYAPIEDILPIARPHLSANGLSVNTGGHVHRDEKGEAFYVGEAYLKHVGGHTEIREFPVPIVFSEFMSNQQSYAAASTFAERYAVRKVLGIVTAEDDDERLITPQEGRAAKGYTQSAPEPRKPVSQPKPTPTAQKAAQAANGPTGRPDLEPAMNPDEAIDAATIKGLRMAMEHAALGDGDFKSRFPKLLGLEQVKKVDARVIMSWIADPVKR